MSDVDRPEWQESDEVVITAHEWSPSEAQRQAAALVVAEIFRTFNPDDGRDRHKARRLADPRIARGYVDALLDTLPTTGHSQP